MDSKEQAAGENKDGAAKPKGKGKLIIGIAAAVVLIAGAAGAGAMMSPALRGGGDKAEHGAKEKSKDKDKEKGKGEEGEDAEEAPPVEVLSLDAIVIDIKGEADEIHHVKVGLAIELTKKMPEEELKSLVPRARNAAIGYLRSLTLAEVASPKHFDQIRTEIGEQVAKAIGKSNVKKVLFTDFVVQ